MRRIRSYSGAGVLLFRYNRNDGRFEVLLGKRSIRHGYGKWSIPGGGMEKCDSGYAACAYRELREETGLHLDHVDQVWKESYSAVGFANEKNICIVGTASGEILPSDSDMEEIEADWYTKAETRALLNVARFAARTQAYCALWSRK